MIARLAAQDDGRKWDEFCAANCASYASYFGWQEDLKTWGFTPGFLLAEDEGGRMCGCLPLCITRGVGARRAFSTIGDGQAYGGPLVSAPEAAPALLAAAEGVLREHKVAWVSLTPDPFQPLISEVRQAFLSAGYACQDNAVPDEQVRHTFRVELSDFDTVWKKRMGVKVRNQTRKAGRMGVVVEEVPWEALCNPYHDIQVDVWRRLGNGCPSKESLGRVLRAMQGRARTYLARLEGKVVGGLYCFQAGSVCFLKGAVSRDEYSSYCVNNLTYARSIEDACRAGMKFYDMGSTPPPCNSGHHHWKAQFGGTPAPLLTYRRVLRKLPYYVDRGVIRLTDRLSRKISYGGTLARLLGPLGRMLVNWRRR